MYRPSSVADLWCSKSRECAKSKNPNSRDYCTKDHHQKASRMDLKWPHLWWHQRNRDALLRPWPVHHSVPPFQMFCFWPHSSKLWLWDFWHPLSNISHWHRRNWMRSKDWRRHTLSRLQVLESGLSHWYADFWDSKYCSRKYPNPNIHRCGCWRQTLSPEMKFKIQIFYS